MTTAIQELLEIASPALADSEVTGLATSNAELAALLRTRNGFFAFESALRVFPAGDSSYSYGLDEWNSPALWCQGYGKLAAGLLCFAEDIFGTQFCFKDDAVYSFDPETADLSYVGASLEEWAGRVLDDYSLLTGYPLAHAWQEINGALAPRDRLMPKIPFVAGGEFSIDNLVAIDAARSMRSRAQFATRFMRCPTALGSSSKVLIKSALLWEGQVQTELRGNDEGAEHQAQEQ